MTLIVIYDQKSTLIEKINKIAEKNLIKYRQFYYSDFEESERHRFSINNKIHFRIYFGQIDFFAEFQPDSESSENFNEKYFENFLVSHTGK